MIWNMFWEFECLKESLRSQHQFLFFTTSMTESPGDEYFYGFANNFSSFEPSLIVYSVGIHKPVFSFLP